MIFTLDKIVKTLLLISIFVFVFSIFQNKLPPVKEITSDVRTKEPLQTPTTEAPFTQTIGGYNYAITPRYDYDIYGLVVSTYTYNDVTNTTKFTDPGNPKDLCLVWKDNINNGIYNKITYTSSEFVCNVEGTIPIDQTDLISHLSNNHLIPADESIKNTINSVQTGDQVHIKGYLADYTTTDQNGQLVSGRKTSITRTDVGNGACETLYVTSIDILRYDNNLFYYTYNYTPYLIGILLVLEIIIFIVKPVGRRFY